MAKKKLIGRQSLSGGPGRSPRVNFRITTELAERLAARAKADGVRITHIARTALQHFLDHRDDQDRGRT